jgi:hypothetical protein
MYQKIIFLVFAGLISTSLAAEPSWLMSIPYALSSEHIYKVRIERVDGVTVAEAVRYPVAAGEHTVTVSHKLDVEWSPDLVESPVSAGHTKELTIMVEAGNTYQLGVRIDIHAAAESQVDQSFWTPFVYRIVED